MKRIIIIFLLFLAIEAQAQKNYVVQLNDSLFEIALDEPYELLVNGEKVNLIIKAKDTLVYNDVLFSFQYPKGFQISKLDLHEGIEQLVLMTAEGTGMIIQKYEGLNPTGLNEMMLNETIKESVNYGFELDRQDYTRKLRSGETVLVNKAVLSYMNETNIYEVASVGRKDEGLLIMTMVMDESLGSEGINMIKMMWDSLELN